MSLVIFCQNDCHVQIKSQSSTINVCASDSPLFTPPSSPSHMPPPCPNSNRLSIPVPPKKRRLAFYDLYNGSGTGTYIFMSHVAPPPLPRDTTQAHYIVPHPKVLEKLSMTPSLSPSMMEAELDEDSPRRPSHSTKPLGDKPQRRHQPSGGFNSLSDALNASTIHNAFMGDYYSSYSVN